MATILALTNLDCKINDFNEVGVLPASLESRFIVCLHFEEDKRTIKKALIYFLPSMNIHLKLNFKKGHEPHQVIEGIPFLGTLPSFQMQSCTTNPDFWNDFITTGKNYLPCVYLSFDVQEYLNNLFMFSYWTYIQPIRQVPVKVPTEIPVKVSVEIPVKAPVESKPSPITTIKIEKISDEKKQAEKKQAELKALAEKKQVELKALEAKKEAELKALEAKKQAEQKALAEKKEAEQKALAEKKEAELKALAEKKEADKKKEAENNALKKKLAKEKKALEKKKEEEEKKILEMALLEVEKSKALVIEEKKESIRKKVQEALMKRKEEEIEFASWFKMTPHKLVEKTEKMTGDELFSIATNLISNHLENSKENKMGLFQTAKLLLDVATYKGHPDSFKVLLQTIEASNEKLQLIEILTRHTEQGNFKAMINLALLYLYGFYVKQDVPQAYEYFSYAKNFIEVVETSGQHNLFPHLGDVLFIIAIIEFNSKTINSFTFFVECQRAAKFGSRRGQIYTGINLMIGRGCEKNLDLAFEWILKAYNRYDDYECIYFLEVLTEQYKKINIKLQWNIIKLICLISTTFKTKKSIQWTKENLEVIKKARDASLTVQDSIDIMIMTQINGFLFLDEKSGDVMHIVQLLENCEIVKKTDNLYVALL